MTGKSIALFVAAALAEIGARTSSGSACAMTPGLYGIVAAFQPEKEIGRLLAAYGGVFIIGSLARGMAFDSIRPERYDLIGAAI